ncbi:hypothetical protein BC938DRAFT_480974, partial [Jimgerdemannia flammicorona]
MSPSSLSGRSTKIVIVLFRYNFPCISTKESTKFQQKVLEAKNYRKEENGWSSFEMDNTVKLFCLVHNDANDRRPPGERAFPVDIDMDSTVGDLKDKIKEKIEAQFQNVDAFKLTLWKVDIDLGDDEKLTAIETNTDADIKKVLGEAEKLGISVDTIDEVFPKPPAKKHISIIVQVP